ncbi:tRNA uridine-5-carboxymethylaminomethyl(34) synthesis GTPase MnmE [Alcaligenes endophyticus]|uniref:tRNA modification GTPase MnmE n=1 Tax=Alcaligenes endophyticus TaxID=1929088 RepID=A0ABT8EF11_9BURK|nr:tRNA uridine-5-carboxymethylaminomethyl(34) synthesis GTPase MnmE [Alcaligenes endophyticus]MCX5590491.1 tRNA uridine-5-carboxymethylaminomethyl(34) synthesis GTPase MnmE [Alcaligenes endophyticus]MDN4119845.1 tRNA uridine-5-carboxymethylaminomethyl(34) synthesis GTPase MnmE [Alcaligenes endophyticus]
MLNSESQPIVAIATAPGRGGIGVIRISGKNLRSIMLTLFQRELTPRHAHFLPFRDTDNELIDEGIALYFEGPHSYTGEDVIELQGHGGPAVLRRLLARCLAAGADEHIRHANPGEFTLRAFLNDRMDLAQAEAVADLIDASSEAAARSAIASLSGAFSDLINSLADRIIHLRMLVEATLDFPEEEIDFLEKYQAAEQLATLRTELAAVIQQAKQGAILREGLHVVLAGQPNVGKSSLLNALAGDDIAIVTDIAGTTRDRVTQLIHLDGVPLHIVDTAGLRDTDDTVESIGIARSWDEIAKANVILHLHDARNPNDGLDSAITQRLPSGTPVLRVFNKIDLLNEQAIAALPQSSAHSQALTISVRQQQGLDQLRKALLDIAGWSPGAESPWLARERHLQALTRSDEHLALAAEHASHSDQVLDLFAEELRLAHLELCSITGTFTSDDLLGEIFSSFCIGK